MDEDAVVQAEANIDNVFKRAPKSQRTGRAAVMAGTGGVEEGRYTDEDGDRRPLLDQEGAGSEDEDDVPRYDETSGGPEYDQFAHLPWHKRPSVFWLLVPFLFVATAIGGIIVPRLNLILSLICREYYAEQSLLDPTITFIPSAFSSGKVDPQCQRPEVQANVAKFTLYGQLISGLISAFVAPKLGALSDRFGRKPLMIYVTCGSLVGEIITIFAATFPATIPVAWILVSFVCDGLSGSFIASLALAHSYATDCTPPQKRNVVFGYFHGAMFTGIAVGPLLGAEVIRATGGVIAMFYIGLACHLAYILLLTFFIPESLSRDRQLLARATHNREVLARGPGHDWIARLRSYNLLEPLKILYPTAPGAAAVRRNLLLLASVDSIIFGVGFGALTTVVLYSQYRFSWDAEEQSLFIAVANFARVTCLLVVLPGLTRLFRGKGFGTGRASARTQEANAGVDAGDANGDTETASQGRKAHAHAHSGTDIFDLSIIRLAIFFDTLGFLGYTLSPSSALFVTSGALAAAGGMASPTLQAALTKHVPSGQVGQLLGAMALLHSMTRVVAPTVFNSIYAATVASYPQAVFVILTSMFALAGMVSLAIRPGVSLKSVEEDEVERRDRYRDELAEEDLIQT